ncbi:MAG: molecular chaperone HtpG [Planctomycetota bacterium]
MSTQRVEKHRFEAEVDQVLSIVVHSLYSHREVFLRELISNASDALDKLAFRSLTEKELLEDSDSLQVMIELDTDGDDKTLTIRDNGVGMSRDELVENLGTIARSGSRQLAEALAQSKDSGEQKLDLIGQFGVGFYSAFLVADRVEVISRAAGSDESWRWESDAKDGYTIEPADRPLGGTDVILHLKGDTEDFQNDWQLRSLVRKYSDYVRHPIRMLVEKQKELEGEKDDEGNPKHETVTEWETINQASALWTRSKSEIDDEQYTDFYKHLSHDWNDPLCWTHFKVEGTQEMTGLLFIPEQAPFDLLEGRAQRGVKLFVKRVFIMEDAEELLPEWLRFVRGVVDSEDLPLNVSRELLQQDRQTRAIKKQVTKKTLTLLEELADSTDDADKKKYETFWRTFGRVLKEGVHYDPEFKDDIARLLRFESTREGGLISLHDYLAKMDPEQPGIFYVTGDSIESCRNSPHLEALQKRGYEVLYMHDPIDEWIVQALTEFEEKKLLSAAKGDLDLPESDEEKDERETTEKEMTPMLEGIQKALDDRVSNVRLTNRLTDSPACLVTDESGLSPHMERILKASGREVPDQKRILELNPKHPVVQKLQSLGSEDASSEKLSRWSGLLFDQAMLAEGSLPSDPAKFAKDIADLMSQASID